MRFRTCGKHKLYQLNEESVVAKFHLAAKMSCYKIAHTVVHEKKQYPRMILSVQAAIKPKYLSFELSQIVPKYWIRFQPLQQTQFKSFNQVLQNIPSIQQGQQRQQLGHLFKKHTFHLEAEVYFQLILSMDLACVSKETVLAWFETAHKRKKR